MLSHAAVGSSSSPQKSLEETLSQCLEDWQTTKSAPTSPYLQKPGLSLYTVSAMEASAKLNHEECFTSAIAAAATMDLVTDTEVGFLENTKAAMEAPVKLEERFLARGVSTRALMSPQISKRRSKRSSNIPMKVFSADTTNFRDMVHQYTAKPTSPSSFQPSNLHLGDYPIMLMRHKPPPPHSIVAGLTTLDTSASLMGPSNQANPLQGYSIPTSLQQSKPLFDVDAHSPAKHGSNHNINHVISDTNPFLASNNPNPSHSTFVSSCASMPNLWDPVDFDQSRADFFINTPVREPGPPQGPYSSMPATVSSLKQASNLERLLMEDDTEIS